MYASNYLHTPVLAEPYSDTQMRLLDAAARVFARDGLAGATTREIAHLAGVNEVTLFRHFHSKQGLLDAVIERIFSGPLSAKGKNADRTLSLDLREQLRAYARAYQDLLTQHLPLIRTFLGEIHRHHDHEKRVLGGVFRPRRQELIERLRVLQAAGAVRTDIALPIAADQIGGMILSGVLRRAAPFQREYTAEEYLESCIEIVARGLEPRPSRIAVRVSKKS